MELMQLMRHCTPCCGPGGSVHTLCSPHGACEGQEATHAIAWAPMASMHHAHPVELVQLLPVLMPHFTQPDQLRADLVLILA
eukprot:671622-Pelagomonas_calceolata.AAC.5